jgi:hypothetical protein
VIGEEENESTTMATSSAIGTVTEKSAPGSVSVSNPSVDSTEMPLPPFPRTFARSAFGIKLGEAELQERAEGLDRWLRGLLQRYQLYSGVVQVPPPPPPPLTHLPDVDQSVSEARPSLTFPPSHPQKVPPPYPTSCPYRSSPSPP